MLYTEVEIQCYMGCEHLLCSDLCQSVSDLVNVKTISFFYLRNSISKEICNL